MEVDAIEFEDDFASLAAGVLMSCESRPGAVEIGDRGPGKGGGFSVSVGMQLVADVPVRAAGQRAAMGEKWPEETSYLTDAH